MVAAARSSTAAWARRVVHPRAWPVRWRLAAVSSGLTLAILLVFGAVIGQIATTRIRDDFNNEVHNAVEMLQRELRVVYPLIGKPRPEPERLAPYVLTDDALLRVFDRGGEVIAETKSPRTAELGRPERGIQEENGLRIETAVLKEQGVGTGYVQYGRSTEARRRHDRPDLADDRRRHPRRHPARQLRRGGDREPRDAADCGADHERPRDRRDPRPLPPHAETRRSKTRSANLPKRSSRCCVRSTAPAPSASRRCSSSASSSPTPPTSYARP